MAKKEVVEKKGKKKESDFFDDLMNEAGIEIPVASKNNEIAKTTFFSTGSLMLNGLISGSLNGGLAGNKVTALAGEEATGKTFISLQTVKNFLDTNPKGHVFIFDSEDDPLKEELKMRQRGIDTSRVHVKKVNTIQEFRQLAINLIDGYLTRDKAIRPPMFMVLDSLGNLSTLKELHDTASGALNKKGEDVRDMTRTSLIRGLFRVLTIKLGEANVGLLITNHTYQTMNPYGAATTMCLSEGTLIAGEHGPVAIENLQVGDKVETTSGFYPVSAVHQYNDEVWQITFDDGSIVNCTSDHKFMGTDLQWIRAEDLNKYDSIMVEAD